MAVFMSRDEVGHTPSPVARRRTERIMNELFFHPKVVHIPIALAVLMPLISGGILLAWWREWLPNRAWWMAVAMQALLAVSAFVAIQSGEREEEVVEEIVPHDAIEEHEEAAETFLYAAAAVTLLFAAGGAFASRRAGLPLAAAGFAATIGVLLLGMHVGEEGGELVYEYNAGAAYSDGGGAGDGEPGDTMEHRGHEEHGEYDDD